MIGILYCVVLHLDRRAMRHFYFGGISMKTKRLTESAMLIAIAVVLVLAIVSIIVRKAIVSARKKRTSNDK